MITGLDSLRNAICAAAMLVAIEKADGLSAADTFSYLTILFNIGCHGDEKLATGLRGYLKLPHILPFPALSDGMI
jgi:hypothetical protein